jgi:hypothetical protein
MATTDSNFFEIQRRGYQWSKNSTLDDGVTSLLWDLSPNSVVNGNTAGETKLYSMPIGSQFMQSSGHLWLKTALPNTWVDLTATSTIDSGLLDVPYVSLSNYIKNGYFFADNSSWSGSVVRTVNTSFESGYCGVVSTSFTASGSITSYQQFTVPTLTSSIHISMKYLMSYLSGTSAKATITIVGTTSNTIYYTANTIGSLVSIDTDLAISSSETTYNLIITCTGDSSNQISVSIGDINFTKVTSSTSSSSINGGAFITDIIPTSDGTVYDKVTSSDGKVLESCTVDTNSVTIKVLALPGNTNYKPNITINGVSVTLTAIDGIPLFTGSLAVDLKSASSISVVHEDGASHKVTLSYGTRPSITSAIFLNDYPGSQTELKAGDTFDFKIVSSEAITSVEFDDYGAFSAHTETVTSGTTHTIYDIPIANRGTTPKAYGAKVRVLKASGSYSDWHLTESDGSVDKVNVVTLNNITPTITFGAISYPASQLALKGTESATVTNTITDYSTVTYSSPNSQLTISTPTIYSTSKLVTRSSGSYNVSTNNLTITAVRSANGSTSSASTVVCIANVACTLAVTEDSTRLISGGNDSTTAQSHLITITSDQILSAAPTLVAPVGTWLGTGFSGSGITWTRSISISDSMTKGTYSWGSITATNMAGITTSTITGDSTYILGGFTSRTITLAAYSNTVTINTEVTNYANLAITWSIKSLTNKRAVGTTATPDANSWSISALNTNPTTITILDTAATLASSSPSTITIQETV